jgi:hypothetical protein
METLAQSVFEPVTNGTQAGKLEVHRVDVAGLVVSFKRLLAYAHQQGDFTVILSKDLSFLVYMNVNVIVWVQILTNSHP